MIDRTQWKPNRQIVLVGDIHGCIEEFNELLEKIKYDVNTMALIPVGDLIDRGPEPKKVVEQIMAMELMPIKGNHDDKAVRFRRHERAFLATGKTNPMRANAERAEQKGSSRLKEWMSLTDAEVDWLDRLPIMIDFDQNWYAIHGGLEPNKKLGHQDPKQVIRCRWVDNTTGKPLALLPNKKQPPNSTYWSELWPGPENIVYGHCVHSLTDVRVDTNKSGVKCYGIDTGCCFGGRLSALFYPQMDVVQVQARREYESLHRSDGDE
jgi:hypothetical protein